MKKLLFILFSLVAISELAAQNSDSTDLSAWLENKIWKVQLPKGKPYAMEMEFRDAGWKNTFLYNEKKTETVYSYSLCGDTIQVFESGEKYVIQELTDSTLIFQYLPDNLTVGVCSVECVTDNGIEGQRKNEERLDRDRVRKDSIGIQEWDVQVMDIIKGMPRWTPAISNYGKSNYRESMWAMNVFFRKTKGRLIAHTFEKQLETGVPVCFLNERGDTIVPYGKYKFCQINLVKNLVFAYENKQDARIVCLNSQGEELFYVFLYDNGPDKLREGLFRIMDANGLIGFADYLGNVVIKPQFKFAFPFENGKAKVTFSGESNAVPDSKDAKHYWSSPDWHYIDTAGKIVNE